LEALNQPSNILDSNSNGTDEPSTSTSISKAASRKSAKLTNAFIKKQSSTKIIQKIKSHKNLDPRKALEATGNLPATLSSTNDSKRPLNAINESSIPKSELTTTISEVKLPPLPVQPPSVRSRRSLIKNDETKSLALTSSCRNIVPPIGILSPGKAGLSRQNTIGPTSWKKSSEINSSADSSGNSTPLSLSERTDRSEGNKENFKESSIRDNRETRERENRENRENREKRRSFLNRDSSRVYEKDISGLLDVIQKMIELEQNIAPQKSENEIRKQLEDVRTFVSSMVGSLTHLSHSHLLQK
jgi:hypothetical protein